MPVRLELPIENKDVLIKHIGKYVRNGERGVAGTYIFTNKINGYCYVGSSISLAKILSTGYLGPKLGNRKIDLAIADSGLDSFFLDIYIISDNLVEHLSKSGDNASISLGKLKNLTLALE